MHIENNVSKGCVGRVQRDGEEILYPLSSRTLKWCNKEHHPAWIYSNRWVEEANGNVAIFLSRACLLLAVFFLLYYGMAMTLSRVPCFRYHTRDSLVAQHILLCGCPAVWRRRDGEFVYLSAMWHYLLTLVNFPSLHLSLCSSIPSPVKYPWFTFSSPHVFTWYPSLYLCCFLHISESSFPVPPAAWRTVRICGGASQCFYRTWWWWW